MLLWSWTLLRYKNDNFWANIHIYKDTESLIMWERTFCISILYIFCTHLDFTSNFSCTSAKFPSRLTPQRITSRLTQESSNALCWPYLEQVKTTFINLFVFLFSLAVAVYSVVVSSTLWLWKDKYNHVNIVFNVLFCVSIGYVAYFIAACVLDFQRAIGLVVLTSLAIFIKVYELLKHYKGKSISRCFKPAVRCFKSNLEWLKWWVVDLVFGGYT